MTTNLQKITIKGTRDGLTLYINDQCSFDDILRDLQDKISMNGITDDQPMIGVTIKLGNRYLTEEQQTHLRTIIREKQKLDVEHIESNVMSKEEAMQWKEEAEIRPVTKVVRSGQVYEVKGDLLLLGDVNPGGKVIASGNIFIMGSLKGVAHAGAEGDPYAVIAASYMQPSQLRIAESISRAPDHEVNGVYMECGYVDETDNKIRIDRLQDVIRKRPEMTSFERRMLNG
ncbi:septum site-determining protein MinC [Thalassobacillus sp. CUG 92003]|uniref:septum site-determining protein MinC n=1 Tax=Thalassobacillus sp. CUG 92003 TaxID=2736641 RepID=UPI0015E691A2